MHTQNIRCPYCGCEAIVNVLRYQWTETPCQCRDCQKVIRVYADQDEQITEIKKQGDCLIITACLTAIQDPVRSSKQLKSFRDFRDTYVSRRPGGPEFIADYYAVAPAIVSTIRTSLNPRAVYNAIYDCYISPAAVLMDQGRNEEALAICERCITELKTRYVSA